MIQAYLCVENRALLRAEPAPALNPSQPITMLDTPGVVYVWNPTATGIDDNNLILKPDNYSNSDLGRYVYAYTWNLNASIKVTGTTNASGNFTFTYPSALAAIPNVQPVIVNGTNTQTFKLTSNTTTGFTVNVVNRVDVVGLLPTYVAVSGASVAVLITV